MADFTKLAATAKRLLDANGRSITITVKGAAVDPTRPWDGNVDDATTVPAIGVFLDYTRREVDGETIQRNDKRCLVAAQDLTADVNTAHKVTDGGSEYRVVNVRVVSPADVALLYELQVRS